MADVTEIIQQQYNLKLYEITVVSKDGTRYEIYPPASNLSYVSMEIVEGMFEASVVGKLVIKDLNSTAEQINFSGFDDLIIKMENPDIPDSYKSLRYKIYNVRASNDQIKNNQLTEETNISNVKLEIAFVSYEHYLLTYKEFTEIAGLTGSGIITKISTNSENQISVFGQTINFEKTTGLVNSIYEQFYKTGRKNADTTEKEMFIEPTSNWVWYKQNQSLYPWSKINKPMKASQLMQFLAEHAVGETNTSVCNYLFWQDLDRWNFRSVESLLQEPSERTYLVSNTPTKTGNIFNLYIINEANYLRLFESNAFSGKYYLVEPKWDEPYRNYMDFTESHKITEITYDYFRDYDKWTKVENYPLLEDDVETSPTVANVIQDNISGYFSPSYSNREKTVKWEHFGYTFGNRDGNQTWQPMFDQTELDGEICKIIQKEIKEKIKQKKIEYAQKKNLKEKWKVYRCSICCDSSYNEPNLEPVFTPEYGVAAAGAFSDLVNFDKGITLQNEGSPFPLGLTFSYDLEEEPFSKTIGEIMYLREHPDIQLKYLYDLELVRVDLAKQMAQQKIQKAQEKFDQINAVPICENGGYCECNCGLDSSLCETCAYGNSVGYDNCGGSPGNCNKRVCFCTEDDKRVALEPYKNNLESLTEISNSDYYQKLKDLITEEKLKFEETYERYRNRKAFFISKELGFTASNNDRNLFNVKKVTRIPIRGSKYEKLAHKQILPELEPKTPQEILNFANGSLVFSGFSAGSTSYYPYEIFYDNNSSISPKDKHPYYDSGYNFEIGYNARPLFSIFEDTGGPHSGNPLSDRLNSIGISYYVVWEYSRKVTSNGTLVSFNGGNSNGCDCSQDSNCQGGGGWGGQGCGDSEQNQGNPCQSCCFSTQNWTQEYPIIKEQTTSKSIDPSKLNTNTLIKDRVLKEKLTREAELRKQLDDGTILDYNISNTDTSWEYEVTVYPESTYGCENRNNLPKRKERWLIEYAITDIFSDNNGNSYLNQFGDGICYENPYGAERLDSFDPIDYINSRNFIDIESSQGQEPKRPIENVLEELESYVRVEFEKPVGLESRINFPKGFYDTPGSEYFLPYQVIISAGPFGSKSVDYNVSVIGQDPYGFDVAVKRIKRKKIDLKTDKKSLTNHKDYHVLEQGYGPYVFYKDNAVSTLTDSYGKNLDINGLYPFVYADTDINRSASLSYNSVFSSTTTGIDIDSDQFKSASGFVYPSNFNYRDNSSGFENSVFTPVMPRGNNAKHGISEVFYHDYLFRTTRKNPLSLPNSYFEFSNTRLNGTQVPTGVIEDNWYPDKPLTIYPGNVFGYWSRQLTPLPVSTEYFKSYINYNPSEPKAVPILAFFEYFIKNRNDIEEPENETTFYGSYYGCSIWNHPKLGAENLSDEEIQKSVWKNDYSGETEYGIIGPELDATDSVFDRNFAAQFVVIGKQPGGITSSGCAGYPCSNPDGTVNNDNCPDDDPVCNCPCKELRPDRINSGITGPEPTFEELQLLEEEIKECTLIEENLGEEWLGCVWGEPNNHLNCNCPCVGEKFLEYLRYSETYCTFWNTPPERPLLRNAQLMQLLANKITIQVNGDLTLRPGTKIKLSLGDKRYSGTWLVSSINHDIAKTKHFMNLTLVRDSEYLSPDKRAKELKLNTEDA